MAAERKPFSPGRYKWRPHFLRIFVAGMVCLHLFFFFNQRERIKRGYPDFTVFYTAATILREGLGHQLYDEHVQYEVQKKSVGEIAERYGPLPYIHPPFEALIFLPLTWLPYPQAFAAWDCFLQGQDSILLLLLCVLGFNALKREADILAGCWFALGVFKFQFILPVVVLLMIWRRRRVAIGFAAVAAMLVLISAGLVGRRGLLQYPAFALLITRSPSLGGVAAGFAPNLRGLMLGLLSPFSKPLGTALGLFASAALFYFAATKGRPPAQGAKFEVQFSLAVAASTLVAWQTNMHDLSLLVLPLVLVTDYCLSTQAQERRTRFSLMLPVLPVLISPLWLILWLIGGAVNLIVIPLLWWVWEIGKEVSRDSHFSVNSGC
jgi:hypothetical protein